MSLFGVFDKVRRAAASYTRRLSIRDWPHEPRFERKICPFGHCWARRAMTAFPPDVEIRVCGQGVCSGSNPVMWGRLLHGWSTPLGGLNSDDARGRGCASGLADGLFGAPSIGRRACALPIGSNLGGVWGRCSFAAGPCFSKLQHRLVRFCLGFASSCIRMWGAEMNLGSLANRPTESAFA